MIFIWAVQFPQQFHGWITFIAHEEHVPTIMYLSVEVQNVQQEAKKKRTRKGPEKGGISLTPTTTEFSPNNPLTFYFSFKMYCCSRVMPDVSLI